MVLRIVAELPQQRICSKKGTSARFLIQLNESKCLPIFQVFQAFGTEQQLKCALNLLKVVEFVGLPFIRNLWPMCFQ